MVAYGEILRGTEPALINGLLQKLLKIGFIALQGTFSGINHVHLRLRAIDANDVVTLLGKRYSHRDTYISHSHNNDALIHG
jgi:hypothetical protein